MKLFFGVLLFFSQLQAAPLFPLQKATSQIDCQWYVPVTSTTEYECKSSCNSDCSIIYGPNYTGYNGCVEQEFGYDCYCGVCY